MRIREALQPELGRDPGPRRPHEATAVETMNPPRTSPAMALPMAPQSAAMMMRSTSPGNVIVVTGSFPFPDDREAGEA